MTIPENPQDKLSYLGKIRNYPMKYYFRVSIFTGFITILSNCLTTLFPSSYFENNRLNHEFNDSLLYNDQKITTNSKKIFYDSPGFYFGILLYKSFCFGYFWPMFYYKAFTNPSHVFTFGGKYLIKINDDDGDKIFSVENEDLVCQYCRTDKLTSEKVQQE